MFKNYEDLYILRHQSLNGLTAKEFKKQMFEQLGVRVKLAEEVETLPEKFKNGYIDELTRGNHDILFYVHSDDYLRFSKFMLMNQSLIKDWNTFTKYDEMGYIYPKEVLKRYANN